MNHADHVNLIRDGVAGAGKLWADLGSGSGAFTLALAELLDPGGVIYSIDRNEGGLRDQARSMTRNFPEVELHTIAADFTQALALPALDGVIAANALHYVRDHVSVLRLIRSYLQPGGRLIVVEYNTDRGNRWVPHPFTRDTFVTLADRAGFSATRQFAARPSRFLGEMYASVTFKEAVKIL